MATLEERILNRFQNVPGVTSVEVAVWLTEAKAESGLAEDTSEITIDNALMYLALAIGYENVASDSARFFSYKDGDESVDKSNVFENYSKLAALSRRRFTYYKNGGTSRTLTPKRADDR